jgi:hypothetical protein
MQTPPPPHFVRSPSPLAWGRMKRNPFSRRNARPSDAIQPHDPEKWLPVFGTRSCARDSRTTPPSTIASRLNRRWDRPSARSCSAVQQQIKGGGTPVDADPYPPHLTVRLAPCKARSPAGVPPRFSPKGLSSPRLSVRPCFLRLGRSVWSAKPAPTGGRRPRAAPRALPAPACPSPAMHLARRS